jgi:hypothetical protein
MKRSRTLSHGKRSGDIRKDLTEAQLAGIGSVAMAYNEAEVMIDILMSLSLGLLTRAANEITGRINGVDGKIALTKIGLREMGASKEILTLTESTLGGFSEYKKYRDAVIHARILDAPNAIALTPAHRGKTQEVLLSVDALNGLYDRLFLIRMELIEISNMTIRLFTHRRFQPMMQATLGMLGAITHQAAALPKPQIEQEIQDAMSRYREHQKRRLSLQPLPKFPGESPVPQGTEPAPDQSGPLEE